MAMPGRKCRCGGRAVSMGPGFAFCASCLERNRKAWQSSQAKSPTQVEPSIRSRPVLLRQRLLRQRLGRAKTDAAEALRRANIGIFGPGVQALHAARGGSLADRIILNRLAKMTIRGY